MSVELETPVPIREFAPAPRASDMVELPLLLSTKQLLELEVAARSQGLSIGQMMRRLINAFLHEPI